MADPIFLARVLAASAMAVILALCAGNAKGGSEPAAVKAHSALLSGE